MSLNLVNLEPRARSLVFLLRHPFPNLSPSERDDLHRRRQDGWLRDEPQLTTREADIINEMNRGFEYAVKGEQDYWDNVWETRKHALLAELATKTNEPKAEDPPVQGNSKPAARSVTQPKSSAAKREAKPASKARPESQSAALVPDRPPPVKRQKTLRTGPTESIEKAPAEDSRSAQDKKATRDLIADLSLEDVKKMSIKDREARARKLVAASADWRGSIQPFFPPNLPKSSAISDALLVFEASTNTVISKPAEEEPDVDTHRPALDRLAELVRFRTESKSSSIDADDFDSDLFLAWTKLKKGRVVERLLIASLLVADARAKKSRWFGSKPVRKTGPTAPSRHDDVDEPDLPARPSKSERQRRHLSDSTSDGISA